MAKGKPPKKTVAKTPAARKAHREFNARREALRRRVAQTTALTILVWGPNPIADSDVARKRLQIRDELRRIGHNALFSEDLGSRDSRSLTAQEFDQAEAAHLVIVLVEGAPGASTEVAGFCNHPRLFQKFLVMVPKQYKGSYFMDGPIRDLHQATGGGGVYCYEAGELTSCHILTIALERAEGVRNLYYRCQRGMYFDEY